MERNPSVVPSPVVRVEGALASPPHEDFLAVEEPLEIRLGYTSKGWRVQKSVSITMRTPGADRELAAGFLFSEGIVLDAAQIDAVEIEKANVVRVELRPGVEVDLRRLERHFYTSSSCGVCGKTSISALSFAGRAHLLTNQPILDAETIHRLPAALRETQAVFDQTGGLHAAALFDSAGRLHTVREDVGRHNAVDKLIGAQLLAGLRPPFDDRLLFVSGRASFELMQKALAAGIPMLAAVGAPSSLAVDLARAHGATLLGFVRGGRFNIYCGALRIRQLVDFGAPGGTSDDVSALNLSHGQAYDSCP
jgi:FdhD protein